MATSLEELRDYIQDILDELCSPRSSLDVKTRALDHLEKHIATTCLTADQKTESKESWDHFLALQYTFECNVPSRLLAWISASATKLQQSVDKDTPDRRALTLQVSRALCIIQGIALSHGASKLFLSRKYSLDVLLELLLASRHLYLMNEEDRSGSGRNQQVNEVPLTSIVLDTLLCILVDSPSALRMFENAQGVQVVVRILKRAGTPREVRMKCLEFLYFYLLDETGSPELVLESKSPPTSPTVSKYGSSTLSSSLSSSRSTSGSSSQSVISVSSLSTPTGSMFSSSGKPLELSKFQSSFKRDPNTPRPSSFPSSQPRHDMMMLKRDVDYEPLSPRKSGFGEQVSVSSLRPRIQTHGQSYTPSRNLTHNSKLSISVSENDFPGNGGNERRKTTDEKKQFLGTMLGNVDALVEGVRKAGIWHLG